MSVFNADFTGVADNTLLTALAPAWLGSGSYLEILSEDIHSNGTGGFTTNYPPTSPATADQQVTFTSTGGSGKTIPGVALRLSNDGQNCYFARFEGVWIVGKRVSGTITDNITSYDGTPPDAGVESIFSVEGNQVKLIVGGVERISFVDNDISAAGQWGVYSYYTDTDATILLSNLSYTDLIVDVDDPIISTPTATSTGSTTCSGSMSTDENNGTLYYLVSASSTELEAAILAGSSQSVFGVGVQNITETGLSASTSYYIHYLHEDAAGNRSNIVSSSQFTTDALSLSVDTTPASIIPGTSATIIIANPTTTPSLGNTTINFVGDAVDASVTNVTANGGGLYSVDFTFSHTTMPDVAYGLRTLIVTVDAETSNSTGLQFVPPSGYAAILITDVSNSDLGVSVPALAIADQIEYETTETDIALAIDANAVATITASNSAVPNNEQFSIRAWDSTDGVWGAWAVYTAVNDEIPSSVPVINSPSTFTPNEIQNEGGTVTATNSPTGYSLSGGDAGLLTISSIGVVTLSLGNFNYEVKPAYTVNVIATNAQGDSIPQALVINIQNVLEVTITDGVDSSIEYANGSGGILESHADVVSWRSSFVNYENYTIIDKDSNVVTPLTSTLTTTSSPYTYTFTASDASNVVGVLSFTEAIPNNPPVITSGNVIGINEGSTLISTITSSGDGTITYSIENINDFALFSIDGNTGALSYVVPPNYENDNIPKTIDVTATNAFGSYTQTVLIYVVNVLELAPIVSAVAGDYSLNLSLNDPYVDPSWSWSDDEGVGKAGVWGGDIVDTTTLGTYNRTFTASNNIGTVVLYLTVNVTVNGNEPSGAVTKFRVILSHLMS